MLGLKPFWRYYGGKWRAGPKYPVPVCDTIVEPFAGAAGYALRYYQRKVVLVEKYARVAEVWRYLISVSANEILRIPLVDSVNDLPAWVPGPGRDLVGFSMNVSCVQPCVNLSKGLRTFRDQGRVSEGWSEQKRARVAAQVEHIRHWRIIEGDYSLSPNVRATWFVDPPYSGRAGRAYVKSSDDIDYASLGEWCRSRIGQVIVCEGEGADWLPFRVFGRTNSVGGRDSVEMIRHTYQWAENSGA